MPSSNSETQTHFQYNCPKHRRDEICTLFYCIQSYRSCHLGSLLTCLAFCLYMKYIITVAETRVLSHEQNFWLSMKYFPDSNKFAVWNKIPTSWENTLKILDKITKFLLQKKYYWSMGKILLILSKYKIRNSTVSRKKLAWISGWHKTQNCIPPWLWWSACH